MTRDCFNNGSIGGITIHRLDSCPPPPRPPTRGPINHNAGKERRRCSEVYLPMESQVSTSAVGS
jgi:hypothetical protein